MYVTMVVEWDGATANEGMFGLLCVLLVVVPVQKVTTRIRKGSFEKGMNTGESPRSLVV